MATFAEDTNSRTGGIGASGVGRRDLKSVSFRHTTGGIDSQMNALLLGAYAVVSV